jgi:hypothetical protein
VEGSDRDLFYVRISAFIWKNYVKAKVKLSVCLINYAPRHEDLWGRVGIAPRFLNSALTESSSFWKDEEMHEEPQPGEILEIRTHHLQNASQKRNRKTQLARCFITMYCNALLLLFTGNCL